MNNFLSYFKDFFFYFGILAFVLVLIYLVVRWLGLLKTRTTLFFGAKLDL